jgi:pyruvate dehydrogenase E2 component (dihydrolipoamide acetyltransferase)
MSLEEEVNQQVAKAIALAEAQEQEQAAAAAAAAPREEAPAAPRPDHPADLASLAPPAPETVANGTPAPARNGADSRPVPPGRLIGSRSGLVLPDSAGLGDLAMPPGPPPGSARPGTQADAPGMPQSPGILPGGSRSGSALSGSPLPGAGASPRPGPLPSGPGRDDSLADRDMLWDAERSTGAVNPDDPTDGIRMMP